MSENITESVRMAKLTIAKIDLKGWRIILYVVNDQRDQHVRLNELIWRSLYAKFFIVLPYRLL